MTLLAGLCMSVRARAPSDVGFEPQVDRCSDWRCSTSSSALRVSVRSVDSCLAAAVAGFLPSYRSTLRNVRIEWYFVNLIRAARRGKSALPCRRESTSPDFDTTSRLQQGTCMLKFQSKVRPLLRLSEHFEFAVDQR
ncbi:hypothetical protein F442_14468 [Phytophthora nicotianae P10297]|uniref:Uncharacterized protein n=1 Tax=Phytophthora nicotianae P10297 TaxID=1317064 RepID=W2YRX1_PHYNI|nr:hypothetical protein F442_14468 [Phytophthora nicotianae P10297]